MGFYYSHDGKWNGVRTYEGYITKMECANTCKEDCRAFATRVLTTGVLKCYQYKTLVATSKVVFEDGHIAGYRKAFVKCKGNND